MQDITFCDVTSQMGVSPVRTPTQVYIFIKIQSEHRGVLYQCDEKALV